MQSHGASQAFAMKQAYSLINGTVQRQATMLSYIDNFWILGVSILALIPLVFLVKKGRPGAIAVH